VIIGVGIQFNVPPDTIYVISEVVLTASHLTDTDKQYREIHKLNTTQQANNTKYSKQDTKDMI